MSEWQRWFAWYPVGIDVYEPHEIRRGKLHYKVWLRMVEWRIVTGDEEYWGEFSVVKYRLPQGRARP